MGVRSMCVRSTAFGSHVGQLILRFLTFNFPAAQARCVVSSISTEPAWFDLSEQFLTSPPGSNLNYRENQMTNIFVGNLSYQTTEQELEAAFANYGAVERANVVRDRETGQPRGFAFIEMTNKNEAIKAIQGLDGQDMNGRAIKVNEARPKEDRGNGGGNRGAGSGRRREPRW